MTRKLRVFLCHASQDKPAVRELYKRLADNPWIDPWLDDEKLLPGQDFDLEIYKAARDSDTIIICLSKVSVAKEGYVNREIRRALDASDEKPEGAIFIIPLRLDDCTPSFERLKRLHYVDYFVPNAHEKLIQSLRLRADALRIEIAKSSVPKPISRPTPAPNNDLDLHSFIKIDLGSHGPVPYPFWIAKYPVTNRQYERFVKADDFAKEEYWLNFPKFDENCNSIGDWKDDGLRWLQKKMEDYTYFPRESWKIYPPRWKDQNFGIAKPDNPVVGITWFEANAYCKWLKAHWNELPEALANPGISSLYLRLPLDREWIAAAGGVGRYPWDKPGKVTTDINEITKRANVIGRTTPVNQYPEGISPHGVMDMIGNVWEWQANYYDKNRTGLSLRGGLNKDSLNDTTASTIASPNHSWDYYGFRIMWAPLSKVLFAKRELQSLDFPP